MTMTGNNIEDSGRTIDYKYRFRFSNGWEKEFNVRLDNRTLRLIRPKAQSYPEWTNLNYFKCPNCPLEEDKHDSCPLAVNLADIIDAFKESLSYEEVDVSIETEARIYMKHTTLQRALSSLVGIYMVTSGCPVMDKLKPMVRYHLPFATEEETRYRAMTMYLLAQFLLKRRGMNPDWELRNLVCIYEDVRRVNRGFHKRIANIKIKDASINALVILDCFADYIEFSINKDVLDELELLFNAYF